MMRRLWHEMTNRWSTGGFTWQAAVALLLTAGCDNSGELLAECEAAVRSLPTQLPDGELDSNPWEQARRRCRKAKGEQAKQLKKEVEVSEEAVKVAAEAREQEEQARKHREEAEARRVRISQCEAEWTSVCELNGRPTGGAFSSATLDKCEKKVQGFREMGAKCVECGCSDNIVNVMNGEMR